jgi:hypothetical protein
MMFEIENSKAGRCCADATFGIASRARRTGPECLMTTSLTIWRDPVQGIC